MHPKRNNQRTIQRVNRDISDEAQTVARATEAKDAEAREAAARAAAARAARGEAVVTRAEEARAAREAKEAAETREEREARAEREYSKEYAAAYREDTRKWSNIAVELLRVQSGPAPF